MAKQEMTVILQGVTLSPGLTQGVIHVHHSLLGPIDASETIGSHNVGDEFSRLDAATASISDDLIILASRVEKEIDSRLAEVFGAHRLMVNDESLREELRKEILDNLVNASTAVKRVFLRWEKRFLLMESQIARDKSDDFRDISIRLFNALTGITVHPLDEIPPGCVLAMSRLLPSDTVFLAGRSVAAVLLEHGSFGSHAALFAREMGLPCISGLVDLLAQAQDGSLALVEADEGLVTIRPGQRKLADFKNKVKANAREFKLAQRRSMEPAVTCDGVTISVLANVGFNYDTEKAMLNGAEGVGLYRLEKVYMGRSTPPCVEELLQEMRQTLLAAKGCMVGVRLLDVGADKPLSFIRFLAETNPALGLRGIRLLREYPELLNTQLTAILELSREFDVRILIPMVTLAEDIVVVKTHLHQLCEKLRLPVPPLGAMIETPAAALSVKSFADDVEFLSFGTNDLTQYAFAADRDNAVVERYFNDSSDVIFRLMKIVHADVPHMPLSLCGELAGRPEYIPQILQCGVRTLSIATPLIPIVKVAIRKACCMTGDITRN